MTPEELVTVYYEHLKDPRMKREEFEETVRRIKILRGLIREK